MKRFRSFFVLSSAIIFAAAAYNFYPEEELPEQCRIDRMEVWKSVRKLRAFSGGKIVKIYDISLGKNPVGDKEYEGDNKTPEGIYSINDKNSNSQFHLNLGISYPDNSHAAEAQKSGKSAGGDIKIHGLRNGIGFIGKFHRLIDWTSGCIAVTN